MGEEKTLEVMNLGNVNLCRVLNKKRQVVKMLKETIHDPIIIIILSVRHLFPPYFLSPFIKVLLVCLSH